jgi:hypothetical protein
MSFNWTATLGTHVIEVKADPDNALAEENETNNNATLPILVIPRPRPVPIIESPVEGQTFEEGSVLTLDGTSSISPTGSPLSFFWKSNSTGYLGMVAMLEIILPRGDHQISLYAYDGYYNESASVNISVRSGPLPGVTNAEISSPINGTVFLAGQNINFDGTQSAPAKAEYVLEYNWTSDIVGPLGSSANFSKVLPTGKHRIVLWVDDGHGGLDSAWVDIEVLQPTGVLALILAPLEGQEFEDDQIITFDGCRGWSKIPHFWWPKFPQSYLYLIHHSRILEFVSPQTFCVFGSLPCSCLL